MEVPEPPVPSALQYPAPHGVQAPETASEKVPAGQVEQAPVVPTVAACAALVPVCAVEKVPAAQSPHEEAASPLQRPSPHGVQVVSPEADLVPAGHLAQEPTSLLGLETNL